MSFVGMWAKLMPIQSIHIVHTEMYLQTKTKIGLCASEFITSQPFPQST
jgi:hypothetical protein